MGSYNIRIRHLAILAFCGLIVGSLAVASANEAVREMPIGMTPLPAHVVSQLMTPMAIPDTQIPASLDYRDSGYITSVKNQEDCGGCYAFAATGCIEAMAVMAGAPPALNLSEQFAISCDTVEHPDFEVTNGGCCGGTATVFDFYSNRPSYGRGTVSESDFTWGNGDFDNVSNRCGSPPWNLVPCPSPDPASSGWYVDDWMLYGSQPAAVIKNALYTDGPVWLGFEVFTDFDSFWWTGGPNDVFTHATGGTRGWHAVLAVGYDDAKSAFIVKNSWGATGPSNDGFFYMSYTANCSFGTDATTCTVNQSPTVQRACCFDDGTCYITTSNVCNGASGTWKSGETTCAPNPCSEDAACCYVNGACLIESEAECDSGGGTFHSEWTSCDPNPCPPPVRICCYSDGGCLLKTNAQCNATSGTWYGELDDCEAFACPSPADQPTWGSMKSRFRSKKVDK
jgi:Papain family cysteine protease